VATVADFELEIPTRQSAFESNGPRAIIRIDGPNVERDLLVIGFTSEDEAANWGYHVAEFLQRKWPDYTVGYLAYASQKEQSRADARSHARIRAAREETDRG
jgi:hypothetical protein